MTHLMRGFIKPYITSICHPRLTYVTPITQLPRRTNTQDASGQLQETDNSEDVEGCPDQLYKYLWLKCAGHEKQVLESYEKFVKLAAENLEVSFVRTEEPFRFIQRRTLLASRFVHKKKRVQYEVRNYYRHMLFKNLTGSTADTFLEYVERNLPEGVLLIVEKHRLDALPFDLEQQ